MVCGESRYFNLAPVNGDSLAGFTARYEVKDKMNKVVLSGAVSFSDNTESEFAVQVQTGTLTAGLYKLHVFITDPSDGYVQVYTEDMTLV